VFGLILFTALSNLLLYLAPPISAERRGALAAVLITDVVVLTTILRFTGGVHNPFGSFYLVHVALAAVALNPFYTALIAGLCALGFASLFAGSVRPDLVDGSICGLGTTMPEELHLRGMLVSFVLTAGCIAFFAGRLQDALRHRERELVRLREKSARQDQFAALATLAAGAAHELGTPLGTILVAAGEISRAVADEPLGASVAEDAELIRAEARRCREILDRMHQKAGDPPQSIEVASLFEQARQRLGSAARLVSFEAVSKDLTIYCPNEALVQATISLVRNAIDATTGDQMVRVSVEATGGSVRLSVVDRGSGLDELAATHAGEPFFTTKPAGAGMGLGLFLVRLLAERVGGSFRLEANNPRGTRAILDLPARS
jgi:two-component system sensor histidine kinase RegB